MNEINERAFEKQLVPHKALILGLAKAGQLHYDLVLSSLFFISLLLMNKTQHRQLRIFQKYIYMHLWSHLVGKS